MQPGVRGIDGVLGAYAQTMRSVQLYGPTNFSQLIEASAQIAQAENQYTILLILTDGVISDMDATIDCIVAASVLPLSIVIVGVGNADFSMMERLDADVTPLVDRRGRKMARDIVQFVPMRDFVNKDLGVYARLPPWLPWPPMHHLVARPTQALSRRPRSRRSRTK